MKKLLIIAALAIAANFGRAQSTFINEINYVASDPATHGVEIAGAAGADLAGWKIITYNLTGVQVDMLTVPAGNVIPNENGSGYGAIWYDVDQNAGGGGVALFNPDGIIQMLLSYGATNPLLPLVDGLAAEYIGAQPSSTNYLRLRGSGTEYTHFSWTPIENDGASEGLINANQTFAPLPVELLSFTAKPAAQGVQLQWVTASELNNAWFEVEKSTDGAAFRPLHRMPGQGNSQAQFNYQYLDKQPVAGLNYYRLRQIDVDGTATLSPTVAITIEHVGLPVVSALNPVTNRLLVWIEGMEDHRGGDMEIYDLAGQRLLQQTLEPGTTFFEMDVSGLNPNEYILLVSSGESVHSERIIKH